MIWLSNFKDCGAKKKKNFFGNMHKGRQENKMIKYL